MTQITRILVARIGRVGDMVMISPALQALLQEFPTAKITLLTNTDGKRVYTTFDERLDTIVLFNRKAWLPWFERFKIKRLLKNQHYDRIYCFESKASFLSLFSHLDSPTTVLPANLDKTQHYAQHCLDIVLPSAATKTWLYPLYLKLRDESQQAARLQLQSHNISNNDFLVGFHPSFSGLAKSFGRGKNSAIDKVWPITAWSELAIKIQHYAALHKLNIKIIMDLVPDEQSIGQEIATQSHGAAQYQCPALNFERYKATLARYDLLISPDSGPMHIAAALKTKVVALFSGHDPRDCQPFVAPENYSVLRAEDSAFPERGLAGISVVSVFDACVKYLPK